MKRMTYLLPVLFLLSGCIKEDMSDCDNVSISFRYYADGDTDVLTRYVDRIDLHVFDDRNRPVTTVTYSGGDLAGDGQTPQFRLPPGNYRLVAVGNAHERTLASGIHDGGDFSRMFIQHPNHGTPEAIDGHDHNYMGRQDITVPGGDGRLHETVRLYSSHVNVSVEIHGLSADIARGPYTLRFDEANAQTDFNNEINPGQTGSCRPALQYDTATGTYRTDAGLALFRMDSHGQLDAALCRHVLRLTDADGNLLAERALHGYLLENSGKIDVTRQEADLPVSITFTPLGVTVEVPSWYIEDIDPDWGGSTVGRAAP